MIKLRADGKDVEFEISKFPDGTSQVWKLNTKFEIGQYFHIDWIWENNEAEVLHIYQLIELIRSQGFCDTYIYLNVPFLPYSRQDKEIANNQTFALHSFARILNSLDIDVVTSFDVHSKAASQLIINFQSVSPWDFHTRVYQDFKQDFTFYPDAGAAKRYGFQNEIMLYGEKVRNQITGNIEGYKVLNADRFNLKDSKILIVDDICDGGATFIHAAKALKELGVDELGLCVSHGLFSKGYDELLDAGIINFFTTNSLPQSKMIDSRSNDAYKMNRKIYNILGEKYDQSNST